MEKSKNTDIQLKVYYDGLCRLCSYEINHYRKIPEASVIEFVDITSASFDPVREGIDPSAAHKYLHTKTADGRIMTGVDSFKEIWKFLPNYRPLIPLCDNKLLRPFLDFGYHVFATHIRPYFQRKTDLCKDSPYCETDRLKS